MSCSICCNDIHDYALGPCNHRDLCAKCMLHYVILFKETKCPTCKEELTSIAITTSPSKSYNTIVKAKSTVFDQHLNVYFDSQQLADAYHNRLGLRCPLCYKEYEKDSKQPNPVFTKEKDLLNHVSSTHKRVLCELCLTNLKVFPYEMMCYTREQYDYHLRNGLNDPNLDYRIDPHPACRFCRLRLFNEKALIEHLETAHQHCIFCPPEANAYFNTSSALMNHYKTHHFVCDYPGCVDEMFSVFSDRIELMQHKQQVHHERVVVDLSELAGDFYDENNQEDYITDSDIKKAKIFLVEDPSGWSAEEIREKNRVLQNELLKAFDGNKDKLERYQHMCGEFLKGNLSPAVFHDMSINLLGSKNLVVFSHLISLITEPEKRHVIETLFRAAKGRKSSSLGKDFLNSIGACETHKHTSQLTSDHAKKSHEYIPHTQSATEAAWESAERVEEELKKSNQKGLIVLSKQEKEEEKNERDLKDIPYPSSYPVPEAMQIQWRKLKKELNHISELKTGLVEKKKIVRCDLLYSLSMVAMEIIHILDEVLSERAKRENWNGINIQLLEQLQDIIQRQGDRELYQIEWLPIVQMKEKTVSQFQEFYDLFMNKDSFIIPSQTSINKNRHLLNSISAQELNIFREVFVLIVKTAITRLNECTKDVEEEQRKRYEALKIPAKPVKEIDYASLVQKEKKSNTKSVWGKPIATPATSLTSSSSSQIKKEMFPSLPQTTKPLTINGKLPVINKKQSVVRGKATPPTSSPISPLSEGDISPAYSSSPMEDKPIVSRFYTPPLPSNPKKNTPQVNPAPWGVRKPDQFELAVENALKEKQQQKKKGKGNRGVKLVF